ncbi:hypothetical protein [Paracoccus salsus]|uniref:hypothetical protein n=1 Tax=Paracoccus salsus TaxID=2911061 RepID=UPI001F256AEC|nr:hypothetical protein [Paracoccus salsus]MCF3974984.1 hypothetical protein [Paracoccus salsus]
MGFPFEADLAWEDAERRPATNPGPAHTPQATGNNRAQACDLTTADVESTTVYGRDDETIGSSGSLKVGSHNKITDAVIDVGGALVMGAHSVLIP